MELIKSYLSDSLDSSFDKIFKERYTKISKTHWTPIEIAKIATEWLATSSDTKILDIGSGVGKFCIVGAIDCKANFYGVEKRKNLVEEANRIKEKLGLENIEIINKNLVDVDFAGFDSFYYFNPFCEQIAEYGLIDDKIKPSSIKYETYENHVYHQLEKTKIGARLVTYYSQTFSPPPSFRIRKMLFNGELVFWEKINS